MAYLLELNIPLDPRTGQNPLTISTCIPDKHKEFIHLFFAFHNRYNYICDSAQLLP